MGPVKGVGVDMVQVSEMRRLCGDDLLTAFARRTFSSAELDQARERQDPAEFLAGRFAVKEAVFKALAHLTKEGFDLRIVETVDDENGRPCVSATSRLAPVFAETGADELLVSITNEGDFAVAFVVAQ